VNLANQQSFVLQSSIEHAHRTTLTIEEQAIVDFRI